MKLDWKKTASVLANGLFALGLYLAIVKEVPWLEVVVIGFVWLMLFLYLMVLLDHEKRRMRYREREYRSLVFSVPFDIAVTAGFTVAEWYFTACAYLLSSLILFAVFHVNPD